ncbi:MAG: ATP-dependent DNA helicase [Polyangiaceae bacterium]
MPPSADPPGRSRALLGPDGPLARSHGLRYEHREGQLRMADAVERALAEASVLLCEAGTGTGKTLAYLVPAILSGQRVVVSTATKALEDQIVEKDLALIEATLGLRPTVALVKGLTNYVCLRRLREARGAPAHDARSARSLPIVEAWARESETGDFRELHALGDGDPILEAVQSSSETRLGPSCAFHDRCFVTRMKRSIDQAQILVVNHHLFFADLALKASMPDEVARAGVLGRFDAVVFDEAHRIEDVATEFFGVRLSSVRLAALARDAERVLGAPAARALTHASHALFDAAAERAPSEGRAPLDRGNWNGELLDGWTALDAALEGVAMLAETETDADERVAGIRRRADRARAQLTRAAELPRGAVGWIERGARGTTLGASFVDVGPFLREHVYRKLGAVVLTSATLTSTPAPRPASIPDVDAIDSEPPPSARAPVGPSFSFVRARLGLDADLDVPVEELEVPSPFDFERSVLLYLPTDLPDVSDPEFLERAADRAGELVEISRGGALVLTTSNRAMRAFAHALRRRASLGEHPLLVQGEGPKARLLDRFREGDSVLVATMSFWEGVDVPGDALRLVIIDKIPFAVPTDPLVVARSMAIEELGGSAFSTYALPQAAITLKQGFGRLVRTASDRGVVAILDRRIVKRPYGFRILSTLPSARRTPRITDVRAFCQDSAMKVRSTLRT